MNEIEQNFHDAFLEEADNEENELCIGHTIQSQVVIGGLYKVDFLVDGKYVIEIDGYEYHKTKEQRATDYRRERFLLKQGLVPIRFTGTEVFLSCVECAIEALKLIDDLMMTADYNEAISCFRYHKLATERDGKQERNKSSERGCGE